MTIEDSTSRRLHSLRMRGPHDLDAEVSPRELRREESEGTDNLTHDQREAMYREVLKKWGFDQADIEMTELGKAMYAFYETGEIDFLQTTVEEFEIEDVAAEYRREHLKLGRQSDLVLYGAFEWLLHLYRRQHLDWDMTREQANG